MHVPLSEGGASQRAQRSGSATTATAVKDAPQERRRKSSELKAGRLTPGCSELLNALVDRTYPDSEVFWADFPIQVIHVYEKAFGPAHPATITVVHEVALTAQARKDHHQVVYHLCTGT